MSKNVIGGKIKLHYSFGCEIEIRFFVFYIVSFPIKRERQNTAG